jgi:hypothetical protein
MFLANFLQFVAKPKSNLIFILVGHDREAEQGSFAFSFIYSALFSLAIVATHNLNFFLKCWSSVRGVHLHLFNGLSFTYRTTVAQLVTPHVTFFAKTFIFLNHRITMHIKL